MGYMEEPAERCSEIVSAPGVINQICNNPNLSGHGTSVPKINYVAANFVGDLICDCVIIT